MTENKTATNAVMTTTMEMMSFLERGVENEVDEQRNMVVDEIKESIASLEDRVQRQQRTVDALRNLQLFATDLKRFELDVQQDDSLPKAFESIQSMKSRAVGSDDDENVGGGQLKEIVSNSNQILHNKLKAVIADWIEINNVQKNKYELILKKGKSVDVTATWKLIVGLSMEDVCLDLIVSQIHELINRISRDTITDQYEIETTGIKLIVQHSQTSKKSIDDVIDAILLFVSNKILSDDGKRAKLLETRVYKTICKQRCAAILSATKTQILAKQGISQTKRLTGCCDTINNTPVYFPDCEVSTLGEYIVNNMRSIFEEASTSRYGCNDLFIQCAKDTCYLYQILVPVIHKMQVEQIPQLAMIFYTDCMYISHYLSVYWINYKLNSKVKIFDRSEDLQCAGENIYNTQLDAQEQALEQFLQNTKQMKDTNNVSRYKQVEQSFLQLCDQLSKLEKTWKYTLPSRIYVQSMCRLIEYVLARVYSMILDLNDIGDEESNSLNKLLKIILAFAQDIFREYPASTISPQLPSLPKFKAICSIMVMKLADITEEYCNSDNSHHLPSLSPFDAEQLIRALFGESDKRTQCIERIQQME